MATTFSDLYPAIRALIVDSNPSSYVHSDDTIDEHIRLIIQSEEDLSIEENAGIDPPEFTEDVSLTNQALAKLKAARSLISGVPNDFYYKSPIMSVRRKGLTNQILANIQKILTSIEGMVNISSESEIDLYFTASVRTTNQMSDVPVS